MNRRPANSIPNSLVARLFERLRPMRLGIGLLIGLLFIYGDPSGGSWLIAIYAVLAIGLKIEAKWNFLLALICLVAIPVLTAVGWKTIADAIAVDCFYLLCLGVGLSAAELRTIPAEVASDEAIEDIEETEETKLKSLSEPTAIPVRVHPRQPPAAPPIWVYDKKTAHLKELKASAKIYQGKFLVD